MRKVYKPQPVQIARILQSPKPIASHMKGINATYYGSLTLSDDLEVNAYIKHIPPNEVFTEVICSLICSAMNLPTPQPYLALLDGDATLPSLQLGDDPILYATKDANRPSFKTSYAASNIVYEMLVDWTHTPCSAVFDEQIANMDRHGGNILIDASGDCSLIDHGLAFNRAVTANSIQPKNTFAELTAQKKDPLKLIEKSLPKLQNIEFDLLLDCSHGKRYADVSYINSIRAFYDTRLRHIRDIFDLRFGTACNLSLI